VFSQTFVEECEIRIDDRAGWEIPVEEFLDEEARFFDSRELERVVEFVVVVERGGRGAIVDPAEIKSVVRESLDEAARLRIIEQAIGLGDEDFGVAEAALRS
jgi:hypothetical protein